MNQQKLKNDLGANGNFSAKGINPRLLEVKLGDFEDQTTAGAKSQHAVNNNGGFDLFEPFEKLQLGGKFKLNLIQ